MTKAIDITNAVMADADALAALHVEVWQQTYRTLAPLNARKQLDHTHRLRSWQALLSNRGEATTSIVLKAEIGGELVGVLSGDGQSDQQSAEIKHLYVRADHAGQGVGRLLMATAAQRLIIAGHRRAALGVVSGNTAALRFYQQIGGRQDGSYTDPGPLWQSTNIRMVWDDLPCLANLAAASLSKVPVVG